tara:strand:+ start:521 stop:844 length:324 start_codon:yes stop_codon:yes gene_type:complete
MAFYIKQNDTAPIILVTLKDGNDAAVDLTAASAVFKMRPVGQSTVKINSAAIIHNADGGQVRYEWVAADTNTMGSYEAEFEITFSDGKIETFPNSDFIRITVTDDIS